MVRLALALCSMAFAARLEVADTDGADDIVEYLLERGESEENAERVAEIVHKHWPSKEVEQGTRNMKASHVLATEARLASLVAGNMSLLEEESTESCATLSTLECAVDVHWAYNDGKRQPWAGEAYYDLPKYTGRSLNMANLEDFHKLFYCSATLPKKCSLPPCGGCSEPPCDLCADMAALKEPIEQCHMHTYCVGMEGACCPQPNGMDHACCSYKARMIDYKPYEAANYSYRQEVPGEELQEALHEGAFLGPLKATSCAAPSLKALSASLTDCADACTDDDECFAFSWDSDKCGLYPRKCNPAYKAGGSMVFVKNRQRMSLHWLPTMEVSKRATGNHFLAVGDWGSGSCPNRESMHYIFKMEKNDSRWITDHNGQLNVAKVMATVGQQVKPFAVVNAGDNFYWGGVLHQELGGRDIFDDVAFGKGFENIYQDPSLMVPWLSIMGNHDYGGDGCMANARAQFDYTIKDMLLNNRWKMPSPYYNHRVNFAEGHSAEFFMLDTNIEDAFTGRHGGICKQTICWETLETETVPYDECKAWFQKLWAEQIKWLTAVMPLSTADWKIVVMHHKPHGQVANKVHPLVVKHNVQLMIGSHTHEMSFMDRWGSAKRPLLVVGAGGGAQANPGCGGGMYCSRPHQYGFSDVEIQEQQMVVRIFLHHGEEVFRTNICRDGRVQKGPC